MNVRRVVTGHDEAGKSVIAGDVLVEPIALQLAPGAVFHPLWGGAEAPMFPDAGLPPEWEMSRSEARSGRLTRGAGGTSNSFSVPGFRPQFVARWMRTVSLVRR